MSAEVSVLHVAQSSEYGLGRYLQQVAADQVRRGWHVVLCGDPTGSLPAIAAAAGALFLGWEASRDVGPATVGEARALARLVIEVDPEVVHLHSAKAGLAGRLALRGRRPTIFQPHAWSFFAVSGPREKAAIGWERLGARWSTIVLCGSEAERAAGVAVGIRARWRVIRNAVDLTAFPVVGASDSVTARRMIGLGSYPVVVCAGRLAIAQKGQDLLLAAWPAVRRAVPDAELVLVGDGPDRRLLEASATEGVRFVGQRDDIATWFAAADVVVAPSRYETLSLSVIEAMASGRSVVATDCVGMREAIGEAGAIVPPGNPAVLAGELARRLRDPELRLREGQAGRERAARSHDVRSWGEELAKVTSEVRSGR